MPPLLLGGVLLVNITEFWCYYTSQCCCQGVTVQTLNPSNRHAPSPSSQRCVSSTESEVQEVEVEVEEEVVVELLPLFSSPAHIATSPQAHLQPTLN